MPYCSSFDLRIEFPVKWRYLIAMTFPSEGHGVFGLRSAPRGESVRRRQYAALFVNSFNCPPNVNAFRRRILRTTLR